MKLNDSHAKFLASAFAKLLPKPTVGSMAFARCLNSEHIRSLCESKEFEIDGWKIFGVVEKEDLAKRLVSADRAVELREDKEGSVLLLVDVECSQTGMDGIYSAVKEIKESELFDTASDIAQKNIKRGFQGTAKKAVEKASRIGRRNTISPWQEFHFYVECSIDSLKLGEAVASLGMWPILCDSKPQETDLDRSVRLVEKLLLVTGTANSPATRVQALMLEDSADGQAQELESFIRRADSKRWNEAVLDLIELPNLWLNELKPGFFDVQDIRSIEILHWRRVGTVSKPASWSGLIIEDDRLKLSINPNPTNAKERSKLEVRWKALPEGLRQGAVEYSVSIVSSNDILAEQKVVHTGKEIQRCKFTDEEFAELDDDSKFDAKVIVRALGVDGLEEQETEDFILAFGDVTGAVKSSSGLTVRAVVEGMINLESREDLVEACRKRSNIQIWDEDKKGFVVFRTAGKGARVYRPALIKQIEQAWLDEDGAVGRWSIKVRTDGSPVGQPHFIPIAPTSCAPNIWERLVLRSRELCEFAMEGPGFLGLVYEPTKLIDEFTNAWIAAIDSGDPELALVNTVEVQTLSGKTIGMIVLPHHPLRTAWHCAYDLLVQHARYEEGMTQKRVIDCLKGLDGSHFPMFLPGLDKKSSFVFGDTLGFYSVAMVADDDKEPKAAIALMTKALSGNADGFAPTVGNNTSVSLGKEFRKYIDLHSTYHVLHVHALRPGDGMTVSKALGRSLWKSEISPDDVETPLIPNKGFVVELYPADINNSVVGQYLSETGEKRRTGAGAVSKQDRWMLETYPAGGGINLPRLRWAKRDLRVPERPAHLSVAFDTFDSRVIAMNKDELKTDVPLEIYGLAAQAPRKFFFTPRPVWLNYVSFSTEGEKHPANRVFTDRLLKMNAAVLKSVVRNLGYSPDMWPVLRTEVLSEQEKTLASLHRLSDWVITVDRNAGVEYFDSPNEDKRVYESYVIDCLPERQSMGTLQLVTSTSHIAEVNGLLSRPLIEMGLSSSLRNCEFLLSQLKALSGRLAMRLANPETMQSGELVALAMLYANCLRPFDNDESWLSLNDGFFVPLDDVPDLLPPGMPSVTPDDVGNLRADLMYVTAPKRMGLSFCFVEVKFRRHLKTARSSDLLATVSQQTKKTNDRWNDYYLSAKLSDTERIVRRSALTRALRFYADKARRHYLAPDSYERILRELDKFTAGGMKYQTTQLVDRGYIFCPEYAGFRAEKVPFDSSSDIYLFGPGQMPDSATRAIIGKAYGRAEVPESPVESSEIEESSHTNVERVHDTEEPDDIQIETPENGIDTDSNESESQKKNPFDNNGSSSHLSEGCRIQLGTEIFIKEPVFWCPSISSNPHLMIVGQPGMGKTTCLVNMSEQLFEQKVAPIHFSFHEDIDERLFSSLGVENLNFVDFNGLGFNPMMVVNQTRTGFVDNAGMLRDIFAAIFPDLGDLQVERIRQAIKQSYTELGWGSETKDEAETPKFQRFYDILDSEPKPDRGLMARLSELNDYGFFQGSKESDKSLLNTHKTSIIRLHQTSSEALQKAFAAFVLHNLYQEMFSRGVQNRISHAVFFDEAHKASKLKLIPTMAKECRKYGIALVVASQEARDFDDGLFAAISNYLILRVTENDAKTLAKNVLPSENASRMTDRLKQLDKYMALYCSVGTKKPVFLALTKV
jgi:hypothetical protein